MSVAEVSPEFEALLEFLRRSRGFDFSGYKRSSLMRRVRKRMQMVSANSFTDYLDYLEVHPEEFTHLFNTILINVTGFFRDPEAWEFLANTIVPRLLAAKSAEDAIRVWCAGCSTGEEAYTTAMVLCDALGEQEFLDRVKIYATDVDEPDLASARLAAYRSKDVEELPPEVLARYFERLNGQYVFRKDLRRAVIFGRHDLVQDAPISRISLLICRNTLMYFNAQTQARILAQFHFGLDDDGYLFLGKAEMLLTHTNLFTPVDMKRRVFTKVVKPNARERLLLLSNANTGEPAREPTMPARLREMAFDTGPLPQLVIGINGSLAQANEQARALFSISSKDIGRPLQDLELSYRPVELRSLIEQAYAERHVVKLEGIEWPVGHDGLRHASVLVSPLQDHGGRMLGASITFVDTSPLRDLQDEVFRSRQELETAYEELQSTVEELETMNEELQSTNEELETINEELRQRTTELNQVNGFLESIMTSLRVGVIVVDHELRVQVWNNRAEDLWGLRAEEVEAKHLLNLDIGLPLDRLRQPLRACLAGEADYQELSVSAVNRRGKAIQCHVTCSPLLGVDRTRRGAILLMDERLADGDAHNGSPGTA